MKITEGHKETITHTHTTTTTSNDPTLPSPPNKTLNI